MMRIVCTLLFTAILTGSVVRGDIPSVAIQIPAPVPGGDEKCIRAQASQATCAAVSDVGALLIIGVQPTGVAPPGGVPPVTDGELLVFPLDAAGAIAKPAEPTKLALTKPPSLAAFRLVPTAIYAHPRLPLVYVWQDIVPTHAAPAVSAPADVTHRDLDHLLIYKVAGPTLQLVKATARGELFTHGFITGYLNSDASPTVVAKDDRLFLPAIQKPNPPTPDGKPTAATPLFGYATLDENGMPALDTAGAISVTSVVDPSNYAHVDRPMGVLPISKQTVLIGGYMQMTSIDLKSRYTVGIYTIGSHSTRATGNAKYPRFYSVGLNSAWVYNTEHVDGAFTMLPQQATVAGMAALSYPVLDTKSNRLLIGSGAGLHMIALNEAGVMTGTQQYFSTGTAVKAVAYSPKFDRIYVPVEKMP
jgi:hypothetical protein